MILRDGVGPLGGKYVANEPLTPSEHRERSLFRLRTFFSGTSLILKSCGNLNSGRFYISYHMTEISDVPGKKTSATEKVIVLGAQMALEARPLHISHLRELYYRAESSATSPDSVPGPPNERTLFFPYMTFS